MFKIGRPTWKSLVKIIPSPNFIISILSIEMMLLTTALVLYAFWVLARKEECLCTLSSGSGGQTILATGSTQTTVEKTTSAVATTAAPVTFPPCSNPEFIRFDKSVLTCYLIYYKPEIDNIETLCAKYNSKPGVVDTYDENARVQSLINAALGNMKGFFYVGVYNVGGVWKKSDKKTDFGSRTSFDVNEINGPGPSVYMKVNGNGYWYQNDGKQTVTERFFFVCQISS